MKASLGFRLLLTGALMLLVAFALVTTELVRGHPLGSSFSLGVGLTAAVVLLVGWLLDRHYGEPG